MSQPIVVVIEQAGANSSAYMPDLPGCLATGASWQQVLQHIREAIAFPLKCLAVDAPPVPAIKRPQEPTPSG